MTAVTGADMLSKRLQEMCRAHDIRCPGPDRITIGPPDQRLSGEVQHDLGLCRFDGPGDCGRIPNVEEVARHSRLELQSGKQRLPSSSGGSASPVT